MFHHYKASGGQYVRHVKQLQQLFTDMQTLLRTEVHSEYLLTFLRYHRKRMNLLYSSN